MRERELERALRDLSHADGNQRRSLRRAAIAGPAARRKWKVAMARKRLRRLEVARDRRRAGR